MKLLPLALFAALVLASCSGRNARTIYDEARAAEDSAKYLVALEKYEEVVRDFPTEAVAETAMFKVVTIRSGAQGGKEPAVAAQQRFLELYPNSGWAPKVTFMLAFNYNNELAQYDSARKYYEMFLAKYPNDELAPSAKFELETIGKHPEELLHERTSSPSAAAGKEGGGTKPR